MRYGFRSIVLLMASTAILTLSAEAQQKGRTKSIWTGGEKGAYYNLFCPPVPSALKSAQFPDYSCVTTGGTLDNIKRVLEHPTSVGFVQTDVYAREAANKPEITQKTIVVRQLPACEGIWFVTRNPRLKNYGDVLGLARRLPIVVAGGGSSSTFEFMRSLDPEGLGRARNVETVKDASEVIARVRGSDDVVGMFVQFADPNNANIKAMMDPNKPVTILPVASRELGRATAGDKKVYQVQTFQLTEGGWVASGKEAETTCTPVSVITGTPSQFQDRDDRADQEDLIREVGKLPDSAFLPKEGAFAALMKSVKRVSDARLEDLYALTDKAKQAMERMSN